MCSLGLVEVLDMPNSCFRIFLLKIFRGPRTHVFVKYFAVLGLCCTCALKIFRSPQTHVSAKYFTVLWLCCTCGGPLTNWNSMDTGTQLSSVFEGICSLELVEVLDTPNSCFRIFSLKVFCGSRTHVFVKYFTVLWLCCACGGQLTNWNSMNTGTQLSSVFEGMRSLGHDTLIV